MCKHYVAVVVLLSCLVFCCGQVILFGDCADVKTMEYFEIERGSKLCLVEYIDGWNQRRQYAGIRNTLIYKSPYRTPSTEFSQFLGKWYTIQRFPSWYEEYGQCAYKLVQQCGRSIEFQHRYIQNGVEYVLHINSTYAPGAEAVFTIAKNNIDPFGIPLSIIRTDYTNFAIVYGCKYNQLLQMKYVLVWILSRSTTLPPEILDNVYKELNSVPAISLAYMEPVSHSEEHCSYHWTAHITAIYYNDTNTNL